MEQISTREEDVGIMRYARMYTDFPITRESWLKECFPEWGTYLNKQIEKTVVKHNTFALWWFGACAFYLKTPGKANLLIDNYSGPSAYTTLEDGCGVCRQSGAIRMDWLRLNPHVIDPWAFKEVDALLSTHVHSDHCDPYTIKPLIQNTRCLFIGPKKSCETFAKLGVPKDRIVELKWGDSYKIKDTKIIATETADYSALFTGKQLPENMEEVSLCYFIKTPAGSVFHNGDSHYANMYYRIGRENDVDVALLNFAHNPPGVVDKTPVYDCYRIAEALRAKVLIPMHYDNWANMGETDPSKLERIVAEEASWIKTVIMQWGGKFEFPKDVNIKRYKYSQYEDRFRPEYSWQYGDKRKVKTVVEK